MVGQEAPHRDAAPEAGGQRCQGRCRHIGKSSRESKSRLNIEQHEVTISIDLFLSSSFPASAPRASAGIRW